MQERERHNSIINIRRSYLEWMDRSSVGSAESLWIKLAHVRPSIRVIVKDIEWNHDLNTSRKVNSINGTRLFAFSVHVESWRIET